ncbi:uncharacterized protein LOC108742601 isoform X3 [Agrilus planipennis]|uniref:Uncharacterized protein LOC108742601 isoform X3 n=1 Tax=Agrilus planipennis TaxID=224129 RepID=A0A7F5R9P2_AGRPL|nr:uncharacterized protein LOC108742601 isoform X3 [Agrilus planipennis]
MDCCNYMQYKFPYYGPYHQYYENFTYESEYYGHQYQNYYGNGPCYQQYWPCATPFPDYVYNPKEARMRKAMREATRDHSLGGIHLQSRGGRPMQSWQNPPEEQLMMNPPSELHPTICGYSSLNGAYMHQMRPYSKTLQTGPSSSWVSNSSFYSQGHSMEPLQHQQGEVWQNYQETNSCATNYIPDAQVHSFPSGSADLIPSISRGNCQTEKDPFPNNYQIQANRHLTENVALNVTQSKMSASSIDKKGSNLPLPMHSPLCCENDENSQQYAQIFNGSQNDPAVPEQNRFGGQKESRTEELPSSRSARRSGNNSTSASSLSTSKVKALPDFNEAFGSTERGRFQSPPDPRLISNKCFTDYNICMDDWVRFDDFRI